jgi:hypothetical protein
MSELTQCCGKRKCTLDLTLLTLHPCLSTQAHGVDACTANRARLVACRWQNSAADDRHASHPGALAHQADQGEICWCGHL